MATDSSSHSIEVVHIPNANISNIPIPNLNPSKIKVHVGLLNNKCYRKLKWRLKRIPETLHYPHYDNTTHNISRDKVAHMFAAKGFRVKQEAWLSYEFEEFVLSHPIDLYVENDDFKAFIEVKSSSHPKYKHQFQASMLLIALNRLDAEYWVYGYKDNVITPQVLVKPTKFRNNLEKKINKILHKKIYPYPDKHCYSCGYGQCDKNPYSDLISQETLSLLSEIERENLLTDDIQVIDKTAIQSFDDHFGVNILQD